MNDIHCNDILPQDDQFNAVSSENQGDAHLYKKTTWLQFDGFMLNNIIGLIRNLDYSVWNNDLPEASNLL